MAKSSRDNSSLDPAFWSTTSWIQLLYGLWVNMAQLGIGLAFGFPAVQVPQLSSPESNIKITRDEASWIASILSLFSPIGCLLSGYLMDKFGRRIMLIMCQGPMCIGWLYTGLAETSNQIIIGRAITGIGCGMAMGPPRIFSTEISLPNMRGVIGAFPALAISMGISMQAGLGYFFAWQFLCYLCSAFTFFNFLVFNLLPETPYFLLIKDSPERAHKNLIKFRGKKYDVDSEMLQLIEFKVDNNLRKLNLMEKINVMFSRVACQPFSLINTYILIAQASGVSVILIWAIEILKTANSSFDVHTGNFLMALTRLVVGTFTSILLFRVGRKPLALSSAVGVSVVCFSLGVFIHYNEAPSLVPQVGFMAYMAFASLGYYTLPFLMMSELYPLQIRGTLGGITVSLTSFFIFGTSKIFPYVRDSMGLANTIVLFGICSLFGTLFLYFFLPETKELTLQEIEEFYNTRRSTLVSQRRIMRMQTRRLSSDPSLIRHRSGSETSKISKDINFSNPNETTMKSDGRRRHENLSRTTNEMSLLHRDTKKIDKMATKERAKRKMHPSDVSFHSLKPSTSSTISFESLKKVKEEDESSQSDLNTRKEHKKPSKTDNLDVGYFGQKLMIHSDESLSFYLKTIEIEMTAQSSSRMKNEFKIGEKLKPDHKHSNQAHDQNKTVKEHPLTLDKKHKSVNGESEFTNKPINEQTSIKDEQLSEKVDQHEKVVIPKREHVEFNIKSGNVKNLSIDEPSSDNKQENVLRTSSKTEQDHKTIPSALKKTKPHLENDLKHEHRLYENRLRGSARSLDLSINQTEVSKGNVSLMLNEDNAVKTKENKDGDSKKVTIRTNGHHSGSESTVSSLSSDDSIFHVHTSDETDVSSVEEVHPFNKNKNDYDDDIHKPSTSKSRH